MSATLPTASLVRRYGIDPATLLRYERSGYIAAAVPHRGSGREMSWPAWVERMVAFLRSDLDPLGYSMATNAGSALRRRLAAALALAPDALWFVDAGGPSLEPCWSDEEALALALAQPGPALTMVSPPLL